MNRRMLLLLALTCGVAVGNVYFPQAVSPLVAKGLHASAESAALIVTATQAGYTAGILLVVPLGDRLPARKIVVTMLALTALSLFAAGCAPSLPLLVAASGLTGLATVVAPVISPLAVGMANPSHHGAVSGTLLSGSIGGILLARTFSGTLSQSLGWRTPYLLAAGMTTVLAVVLARVLPATSPSTQGSYLSLLATTARLLRTEPDLRRSSFYQALVFAGFSAVWTCVALLLTGPAYHLGAQSAGLLGLTGVVTMACTPIAGRLVDRHGPAPVNVVCLLAVLASTVVLAGGARGGGAGLVALTGGTLLLDAAMQCGMVANVARVYALAPGMRSRLNTAYMTCAYLGGSAGSWLGARSYARAGWLGVCSLVALLAVLALARHLVALRPWHALRG